MTITNKGYGALGKGMTAFESRMDALRRIKEAVPGVFDKGTPPTKTGDTRTEKLGMGIMQALPEEEQVAVNYDTPSLFPTERERERRIGEERLRKTLEDLRKQFENYHLNHPSKGASSAPLSEYVIAKLQPESVSQEGIAQLPAFRSGGIMDKTGGIMSALGTAGSFLTKLGMSIPTPITIGLGILGSALNFAGAPKGMSTANRIGRAVLPFGKTIFPGPSQDGGGINLGTLNFDKAKAEGRGTFNPNAGPTGGQITIDDLRAGKTSLTDEEKAAQLAQFIAQQERGLARIQSERLAPTNDGLGDVGSSVQSSRGSEGMGGGDGMGGAYGGDVTFDAGVDTAGRWC